MQIGLKIGVKTRGCNGLTYTMEYAKEKAKFDEEVLQDGEFSLFAILMEPSYCRSCPVTFAAIKSHDLLEG